MEKYFVNNISVYTGVWKLMVNVDRQRDLQRQTQNDTVNIRKSVTLLGACLTFVDVGKK
jgi:hypothetical protein